MLNQKLRTSTIILMAFALLIGTAAYSAAATSQAQQPGATAQGWCPGPGGGWGGGPGYQPGTGNGPGPGNGTGWGCGQGWTGGNGIGWCNGAWGGQYGKRGTQFMAHGSIVAMDADSITVSLDGGSPNLLAKLNLNRADLPADVTLRVNSTVKVWGCGWRNSKWGSGNVNRGSLKAGDVVNLMGYFEKTSGDPVVSKVNVWFY